MLVEREKMVLMCGHEFGLVVTASIHLVVTADTAVGVNPHLSGDLKLQGYDIPPLCALQTLETRRVIDGSSGHRTHQNQFP